MERRKKKNCKTNRFRKFAGCTRFVLSLAAQLLPDGNNLVPSRTAQPVDRMGLKKGRPTETGKPDEVGSCRNPNERTRTEDGEESLVGKRKKQKPRAETSV